MVSDTTSLEAAAVLAGMRRSRREADLAESAVLARAVEWGMLHSVTDRDEAATWVEGGVDTGVPLGGEGVPLVAEFAVPELAAALGVSTDSGRSLLADALELAHRLPRLWARVQGGEVQAWRARRIARQTQALTAAAAGFVDRQVAAFAHRLGLAQLERLVDEAIARFMPETARERQRKAAGGRHFDIEHDQVSFSGTSRVHGELDLADALDLEAAIAAGAEQQRQFGSGESLDVRRSRAAGELARRQLALDLDREDAEVAEGPRARPRSRGHRRVVLHVHLSDTAIRSHDACAPGRVENAGGHLVTAGQIADWCGAREATIVVKPVIDLAEHIHVTSYEVPERLAEQVALRDHTCVFPWCTRPARRHGDDGAPCDHDHVVPHARGAPTCSDNIAPLCRRHHRLKTHGGWRYTVLEPGSYLWSSPHGYSYLRDHTGTEDITRLPVTPPDS